MLYNNYNRYKKYKKTDKTALTMPQRKTSDCLEKSNEIAHKINSGHFK